MKRITTSNKQRWRRKYSIAILLGFLFLLAAFIFLNNSPLFVNVPDGKPFLIANGGLSQPYHREGLTNQTCTASRIFPPKHSYKEYNLLMYSTSNETIISAVYSRCHALKKGDRKRTASAIG
jgi:hypothetical protein